MSSKKNVWSHQQQQRLFALHSLYGNKWATIAAQLCTKDQNAIKNKFYSTLRKGLRKMNNYITEIKKKRDPVRYKSFKTIQQIFVSKIIAVVDHNYDEKYEVRSPAVQKASDIQQMLIAVARSDEEYVKQQKEDYGFEEGLLGSILDFNKNCKKRKGKKKETSERGKVKDNDQEEEEMEEEASQKEERQDEKGEDRVTNTGGKIPEKVGPFKTQQVQLESFPFIKALEKKVSTSTIVKVNPQKTQQFIAFCENHPQGEQGPMILSSTKITHSGFLKNKSQLYESTDSKIDMMKKLSYLTEASPFPCDAESPHSFGSLMKAYNITVSNMFQDKISQEFMGNSSNYAKEGIGSFLSEVPVIKQKSGQFLIQSGDMKEEIKQESLPFISKMMDKSLQNSGSLFHLQEPIFPRYTNSNFASEYAFALNNLPNMNPSFC